MLRNLNIFFSVNKTNSIKSLSKKRKIQNIDSFLPHLRDQKPSVHHLFALCKLTFPLRTHDFFVLCCNYCIYKTNDPIRLQSDTVGSTVAALFM